MRSSYIITTDPQYISGTDTINGAVLLGIIDDLAYVHIAPNDPPRRFLNAQLVDGTLTFERELAPDEAAPDGATIMVVGEYPPFPWGEDYAVVFDPEPVPFQWTLFEAAEPDIAAQLMPNQWAGE